MQSLIISIVLQICAVAIDAYIAFSNNKRNILIATFSFNFLTMLLFLLLGDFPTVYSCILIVSRSFIYIFQDRLKKYRISFLIPVIIMICHLVIGMRAATSWWHILPILAPIIVCFLLWFEKSRQNMRIEQAMSDTLWLVYNIHCGLYILCISRVISILCGITAYVKNCKEGWRVTGENT